MKKYLFNWYELKRDANNELEAILTLTYALLFPYNTPIAKRKYEIEKKLKIEHIPGFIFQRKYLVDYYQRAEIITRYKCESPLSYFCNPDFLFSKAATPREKVEYLYLLSRRAIDDNQNEVPKDYFEQDFRRNPFIKSLPTTYKFTI